jgi:hypothetical protein
MHFIADNNTEGCDITTLVPAVGVGVISGWSVWTTIRKNRRNSHITARKGCLRAFWRFVALTDAVARGLQPFLPKGLNRHFVDRLLCGEREFLSHIQHFCKTSVINKFTKAEGIDSFQLLPTAAELKKQPVKHRF